MRCVSLKTIFPAIKRGEIFCRYSCRSGLFVEPWNFSTQRLHSLLLPYITEQQFLYAILKNSRHGWKKLFSWLFISLLSRFLYEHEKKSLMNEVPCYAVSWHHYEWKRCCAHDERHDEINIKLFLWQMKACEKKQKTLIHARKLCMLWK